MPTYDYVCKECDHSFEAFQSMKDDPLTTCPSCGKETLKRLIGTGAGIIFKGSGFYETDYKKDSSKKADNKKTESSPAGGSSESKSSSSSGTAGSSTAS